MTDKTLSNLGWVVATLVLGLIVMTSVSKPHAKSATLSAFTVKDAPQLMDFNDSDLMDPDFKYEEIVDRENEVDPCLGEIGIFAGNYAPRGWTFAEGQILPIAQHQSLFSLYGTMYGGDGRTTFGLPDLRGRTPIHMGSTAGRSFNTQGAKGGATTTPLILNSTSSEGGPPGSGTNPTIVSGLSIGQPQRTTMQPFLTVSYIVALQGIYCSRN